MATTVKRRVVANRTHSRKLTRKQILAGFGGKRRQSAAKHRRRTKPNVKSSWKTSWRKLKKQALDRSPYPQEAAHKAGRRSRSRGTHGKKKNPGEIFSVLLNKTGQTGKKGPSRMAAKAKKRRPARRNASHHHKRRATTNRRRHMAAAATHRRKGRRNSSRRSYRRNAGRGTSSGPFSSLVHIGISIASAFGAKYLTQAVLGASNTGFVGYVGNGLATAALALVAKMFGYGRYVNAIIAGGALQIAIRVASDFTPYGAQLSQTGLGDYQVWNGVTPQRYVDPLNSAMVQIPQGWAPQIAAPPAAGMGSVYDFDGLYGSSSAGLYS